jgi:hypothetical protein
MIKCSIQVAQRRGHAGNQQAWKMLGFTRNQENVNYAGTQEAEIRRIAVQTQPRQIVCL